MEWYILLYFTETPKHHNFKLSEPFSAPSGIIAFRHQTLICLLETSTLCYSI